MRDSTGWAGTPLRGDDLTRDAKDFGQTGEFPGIYMGTVEDVQDPERRGRIRVRVSGIHSSDVSAVPTESLVWAEACFPIGFPNGGMFMIPYEIGDPIWVMFVAGKKRMPVWLGGRYGMRDGAMKSEAPTEVLEDEDGSRKRADQYPRRWSWKTHRGHRLEFSDEEGQAEIVIADYKGNYIHMDTETGELKIFWDGNVLFQVSGDFTQVVKGNVVIRAVKSMYLQAKEGFLDFVRGTTDLLSSKPPR